jgi:hypothetical protein
MYTYEVGAELSGRVDDNLLAELMSFTDLSTNAANGQGIMNVVA